MRQVPRDRQGQMSLLQKDGQSELLDVQGDRAGEVRYLRRVGQGPLSEMFGPVNLSATQHGTGDNRQLEFRACLVTLGPCAQDSNTRWRG